MFCEKICLNCKGTRKNFWTIKKRQRKTVVVILIVFDQTARVTLPERRQREQTYACFGVPFSTIFTRLMFGFQVRLERRWEWETRIPNCTHLPQTSHFAIVGTSFDFARLQAGGRNNSFILADAFWKIKGFLKFFWKKAKFSDFCKILAKRTKKSLVIDNEMGYNVFCIFIARYLL